MFIFIGLVIMAEHRLSKEKHRILRELDVGAAMKDVARKFIPDDEEIALAGLHRARILMRRAFTKAEVAASRKWLEEWDRSDANLAKSGRRELPPTVN